MAALLFWFGRPLTLLVLVQNSEELRATGGFISTVGTVRLGGGRLGAERFQKVYAAEGVTARGPFPVLTGVYVQPPGPMARYMGIGEWRLRDANWWADFPATASQAARFWSTLTGDEVDGVVAVTDSLLESLLEVTGPVTLPGADGAVVDRATWREQLLVRIFASDDDAGQHGAQSRLSADLLRALQSAVLRLPPERWPALWGWLDRSVARHDLLIAPLDPRWQWLGGWRRLDGRLDTPPPGADVLALVETNLAYAKLSPAIRQSLTYTVTLATDATPQRAELALLTENTYQPGSGHTGYPASYYDGARWLPAERRLDAWPGYYGGFTRVLVPAGSRYLSGAGFTDPAPVGREAGLTVFAGYQALHAGQSATVRLAWQPALPATPRQPGSYRLWLPRQPGSPDRTVTVRLLLPPGRRLAGATPPADAVGDGMATWSLVLDRDRTVEAWLE